MPPQSSHHITWHRGSDTALLRHLVSLCRRPDVPESTTQQDEIIRGIAATEEEQLEAQQEVTESSDSSDDDYLPIPHMPPCRHDAEAGSSSSAPPAPQTDPP